MGMTQAEVWMDTRPGENFSVASNYRVAPYDIFIVNHSRTHPWRYCVVPVSYRSGAEDLLEYRQKKKDRSKTEIYSVDMVYRQAEKRDMSEYETGIRVVTAQVQIGGQVYYIPPAEADDVEPEPQMVKEGAWDLYCGNYERMHSDDPTEVAKEKEHLSLLWLRKKNPVFLASVDGAETDLKNPYGFLEIRRVTRKTAPQVLDKSFITAAQLVEV